MLRLPKLPHEENFALSLYDAMNPDIYRFIENISMEYTDDLQTFEFTATPTYRGISNSICFSAKSVEEPRGLLEHMEISVNSLKIHNGFLLDRHCSCRRDCFEQFFKDTYDLCKDDFKKVKHGMKTFNRLKTLFERTRRETRSMKFIKDIVIREKRKMKRKVQETNACLD